jgi:hypothetical protein
MKTRNLAIYHCLSCGAVMHCEPEEDVPVCCQKSMVKAGAETVAGMQHEDLKGPAKSRTNVDHDRLDSKSR